MPLRDFVKTRELHHLGGTDRRDFLALRDDAAAGKVQERVISQGLLAVFGLRRG